jgi:hypothetical protein
MEILEMANDIKTVIIQRTYYIDLCTAQPSWKSFFSDGFEMTLIKIT